MLPSRAWKMSFLGALRRQPWPPSCAVPEIIEKTLRLEEEKTPYYDPNHFYPVRLGQILNGRYQIATKLGYGTSSTVWLARDLQQWIWNPDRYVAIKIHASIPNLKGADNELAIAKHICQTESSHHGRRFVRRLLDSFKLEGTANKHTCLVFEPFREPFWLVKTRFRGDTIPADILKVVLQEILHGLDYLHSDCKIIHTDLKSDNIMATLEDRTILEKSAQDEYEHPLPQGARDDRAIYLSRNHFGQPSNIARVLGRVVITDFGFSVQGDGPHFGPISAESLRAPEVVLDTGWSYPADIWSLGVMIWDLLEKKPLFPLLDGEGNYDDNVHIGYITALLGPPPSHLLERGKRTSRFYHSNCQPKAPCHFPISFDNSIQQITGDDKQLFIKFIKRILTWDPAERATAKELLRHPWLYEGDPETGTPNRVALT